MPGSGSPPRPPEAYRGHVWNPEHMTGSNVPSRSRGTSMPTGPVVSVGTVLDPVPLRTLPVCFQAASCFSSNAVSMTALSAAEQPHQDQSGTNPYSRMAGMSWL
jgi:hypothetical protein